MLENEKKKLLGKKELDLLVERLETEKAKLVLNMKYSPDEYQIQNEDRCDALDQACADSSNATRLRFRNREILYLKKLNKALERVAEKTYGYCEECDESIGYERLVARPTADLCIACKEESERMESSNFMSRKSKSMGDSLNLSGQI